MDIHYATPSVPLSCRKQKVTMSLLLARRMQNGRRHLNHTRLLQHAIGNQNFSYFRV